MLRETVQHHIDGDNGTFQHGLIRFPRGQTLHLQPGPAKDAGELVVRMGKAHQHFIADAGHDGEHREMEQETMALSVLKVLRGETEAMTYSGKNVWQGFEGITF